jgi:hypothetical protein
MGVLPIGALRSLALSDPSLRLRMTDQGVLFLAILSSLGRV